MAVEERRAVGVGDCCWCEVRGDVVVAAVVVAVVHGMDGKGESGGGMVG